MAFPMCLQFQVGRRSAPWAAATESELWGEVFEPLKDAGVSRAFRLDEELNTIVWPCGADFAPEFLYEKTGSENR